MQKTKILIVDDKPPHALALAALAVGDVTEFMCASCQQEALTLLLEHEFALVLIDVQPMEAAFAVARALRASERGRALPIIFVVTTTDFPSVPFEGYCAGSIDYVARSLDPHVFRSRIRAYVELDQRTRCLHQSLHEIETLKLAANAAKQAKSSFLANMSHEIRTPLGAVMGYSEILRDPGLSDADRQSCLMGIDRNGKLLLRLIDGLLDLARTESDLLETDPESVPLAELLHDVRVAHAALAAAKGVSLSVAGSGTLPRVVRTDPLRLSQVLHNIVDNAVKFTDRGMVSIDVALTVPMVEGRPLLRFAVQDTGRGLTAAQAARIFDPFEQGDASMKRPYAGTGLGLAISRRLARLLGGDVILQRTEPEVGSCFEVTIDPGDLANVELVEAAELLALTVEEGPKPDRPMALKGLRVMLVDDARDNRAFLAHMLQKAGAVVDVAEDGEQAVRLGASQSFDAVIMDIQMPNMDGYEATRRLRQQGFLGPIIALTAHAMRSDLERCLRAGCDDYLSKPVTRVRLIETLTNRMRSPRRAEQGLRCDVIDA